MKRILWWTFVAPLGLLALCVIVLLLFKEKTRRDLDAYKAELISKGETFEVESLGPKAPRETDEPAKSFVAACEKASQFSRNNRFPNPLADRLHKDGSFPVTSFSETARYRNMRDESGNRLPWDEIAEKFKPCEELLSPIRESALKEHLEFHPDYALKGALRMPYSTWLSDSAALFQGDALIQMKKGDTPRAIEDIEAILRIGQIFQKQPLLMHQVSAYWSYRDAAGLTWQIIHSRSANAAQLHALQRIWEGIDPLENLAPTIRLESANTVFQFSDPDRLLGFYFGEEFPRTDISKLKLFDQAKTLGAVAAWRWTLLHIDESRTLESLQQLLRAIGENRRSGNLPKLHSEANRVAGEALKAGPLINRSSTPSVTSVVTRGIEVQAIVNLTVTALALERYQLANGGYPTSLEKLAPDYLGEIPKDPYDNSPLRYRKTSERFVLYSIGHDLIDDNASKGFNHSYSFNPFERSPDITWPLPSMTPNDTAEKPRIVPKKFVRRMAAPTPTPARRALQNTP